MMKTQTRKQAAVRRTWKGKDDCTSEDEDTGRRFQSSLHPTRGGPTEIPSKAYVWLNGTKGSFLSVQYASNYK